MHPSLVQLGRLHLPVFAVFVAIGLVAALLLSQPAARHLRLDPDVVWDTSMMAVVAAFVISRLLLIVFNLTSFLAYPLLLLAVPSLTSTGVLLTGIFMYVYVRWRRIAFIPLLAAVAPSAALLWGFVNLGYFVEGTRDGMPTPGPGSSVGRAQPVEIYTLLFAAMLCAVLFFVVRAEMRAGTVIAFGLIGAGVSVFVIDFLRLPSSLLANSWLDPAQIIGLAMCLAGVLIYRHRAGTRPRTSEQKEAK